MTGKREADGQMVPAQRICPLAFRPRLGGRHLAAFVMLAPVVGSDGILRIALWPQEEGPGLPVYC